MANIWFHFEDHLPYTHMQVSLQIHCRPRFNPVIITKPLQLREGTEKQAFRIDNDAGTTSTLHRGNPLSPITSLAGLLTARKKQRIFDVFSLWP